MHNNGDMRKHEKKRPTLRFSEMIRHDWTTFSRDKADLFDDVEMAVYGQWRQLDLTSNQLDQFGVNSDAVNGTSITCAPSKPKKSTWLVAVS